MKMYVFACRMNIRLLGTPMVRERVACGGGLAGRWASEQATSDPKMVSARKFNYVLSNFRQTC